MYERGDASRAGPDIANLVALALADLDVARSLATIGMPGYRLYPLKRDLKVYWSISISRNWRLVFRFDDGDPYQVELTDYN